MIGIGLLPHIYPSAPTSYVGLTWNSVAPGTYVRTGTAAFVDNEGFVRDVAENYPPIRGMREAYNQADLLSTYTPGADIFSVTATGDNGLDVLIREDGSVHTTLTNDYLLWNLTAFSGVSMNGKTIRVSLEYKINPGTAYTGMLNIRFNTRHVSGSVSQVPKDVYYNGTDEWIPFSMEHTFAVASVGFRLEALGSTISGQVPQGFSVRNLSVKDITDNPTELLDPYVDPSISHGYDIVGRKLFETDDRIEDTITGFGDSFINTHPSSADDLSMLRMHYGARNFTDNALGGSSLATITSTLTAYAHTGFTVVWDGYSTYSSTATLNAAKKNVVSIADSLNAADVKWLWCSTHNADHVGEESTGATWARTLELNNFVATNYPLNYVDTWTPCVAWGATSGIDGDLADYTAGWTAGSLRDDITISSINNVSGDTYRVTTASAHSKVNGDSATIRSCTVTAFNGDHVVSNVASLTYDITVTGSPANATDGRDVDVIHLNEMGYAIASKAMYDKIVDNCWDLDSGGNDVLSEGIPVEGARTNYFINSNAPVTQTIDLTAAGTGYYTVSVIGTGTATSADTTATSSGHGAATEDTPITFNMTIAGSVSITLSGGTPAHVQVEKHTAGVGGFCTSPIVTAGASATRNASGLSLPAGTIPANDCCGYFEYTPPWDSDAVLSTNMAIMYSAGANGLQVRFSGTAAGTISLRKATDGTLVNVAKTYTAGETLQIAWRISSTAGCQMWINGTAGTNSANTTAITASQAVYFGNGTTAAAGFAGSIKNFRVWNNVKPDAFLLALTTFSNYFLITEASEGLISEDGYILVGA